VNLDQDFFSFLFRYGKKRKLKALHQKKDEAGAVYLSEIKEALTVYANAIFFRPIEIRETSDYPYLSGVKLFLPSFLAVGDSVEKNGEAYLLIVLHLHAIAQACPAHLKILPLSEDFEKVNTLIPNAIKFLAESFPNYEKMYSALTNNWSDSEKRLGPTSKEELAKIVEVGFDPRCMWGRLPRLTNVIDASSLEPEMREAPPERMTERESKTKGSIKKVELDEEKENIGQDVFHHFEKVETAEEYKGVQRETDGSDQMAEHADALDELNLENVTRSSKAAQSLYKTEIDMGFEVTDAKERELLDSSVEPFYYDEWDDKKRVYKKDWCRVLHFKGEASPSKVGGGNFYDECIKKRHSEIKKLKKKLIQLASEIRVEKKLFYGRNIDIDNVIRNACLRKHGNSGDQRYYQETKKRHRDMACLLLVDTSLSSDSWVQNRRILDVSLDALITFGEASQSLGDPIMVAGFNSNTRNDCKFIEWKSFDEPWSKFISSIDSIRPAGYTRIGPSLRHATKLLTDRKEKHKLLLVFTDGRPTDFDRYEGSYGLGDVRQAVREADREGVVCFALALDPSAKQFLPRLFGLGNFQILANLESLPEVLTKLYGKIAKRK